MAESRYVVASMNYAVPMAAEPEIFFYEPGPERIRVDPVYENREVRVHDLPRPRGGRPRSTATDSRPSASTHPSAAFASPEEVGAEYYPAVGDLVARTVGAREVHVFDHNFRSDLVGETGTANAHPVRLVHNDYSERSGPQRVRGAAARQGRRAPPPPLRLHQPVASGVAPGRRLASRGLRRPPASPRGIS